MANEPADGSVVVDVLLDSKKAQKYWKDYVNYMEMSTKQLENKLSASAKRIEDLTAKRTSSKQRTKALKEDAEEIGKIIDKYTEQLEKAKKKKKEFDDYNAYLDKRSEELVTDPNEIMKKKLLDFPQYLGDRPKVTAKELFEPFLNDDGTLYNEEEVTKEIERQQNLLQQALQRYDMINEKVKLQQNVTKNINQELTSEKNKFDKMNNHYIQMKNNNEDVKQATKETSKNTKQIEEHTAHIKRNTKSIGANIKSGVSRLGTGLKNIIRMSLTLVGVRSAFTGIATAMRSWLNTEDELAKKTKATLENLKLNFAQMLQPALQWVLNAFNNILGLMGAIVKQFTKMNVFAKKTAQNTGTASKNAQNTLASFDKIDVLQRNENTSSGESQADPIDMEGLMAKYENLAKKIKEILEFLFDPFKKAWEEKGEYVINSIINAFENLKSLAQSIWSSFAKIWENGTIQRSAELLLGILGKIFELIGNIIKAIDEAWNYNGIGDTIIQNLANALNGLLRVIQKVVDIFSKIAQSNGFKNFVIIIGKGVNLITEIVKTITETWGEVLEERGDELAEVFDKLFNTLSKVGDNLIELYTKFFKQNKGTFKEYINLLIDCIKVLIDWWNVLGDIVVLLVDPSWENLKTIGEDTKKLGEDATKAGTRLGTLYKTIEKIAKGFEVLWRVLNVTKYIGNIPILVYDIMKAITKGIDWEDIKQKTNIAWTKIKEDIFNVLEKIQKEGIPKVIKFIEDVGRYWEMLKNNLFSIAFNIYSNVTSYFERTTRGVIEYVKGLYQNAKILIERTKETFWLNVQYIGDYFENLKTRIGNIWEGIKQIAGTKANQVVSAIIRPFEVIGTTLSNVFQQVRAILRTPLNSIISMIETMINYVLNGLNGMIDKVNSVTNNSAIQRILGFFGKSSPSVGRIQPVYLPRLAKGGIVSQATPAIIGEAGKEAILPLENNTEWLDMLADKISQNQSFSIKFNGSLSQLAKILKPEIDKENRRVGKSYVVGGA